VTEVTVFKDGHAFVLQEGRAAVDASGDVTLDRLPQPVLGTFWPYTAEPGTKLVSVTAGQREGSERRSATSIRDMLEANIGATAHVFEVDGRDYVAKIVALPRSKPRSASTSDANTSAVPVEKREPEPGSIAILQIENVTKVVPIDRIRDVLFDASPSRELSSPRWQNVLTLHLLDLSSAEPRSAKVGFMYLQKGLRWIPSYKVSIDGKDKATISLQATLVNELTDLKGATVHLVVGVPTFAFKDSIDPIALQQAVAQLGPHFQRDSRMANMLSNAIMSQTAQYRSESEPPSGDDANQDGVNSAQQEDLFVFTLEGISLAKGERMVLPIAEYSLAYRDVYVLDIPWSPPMEVRQHRNDASDSQLARLMAAPKVMHRLRIKNESAYPLTTAPALIVLGNRPLAQGMMKYTAVGSTTDLDVTTAVDVASSRTDLETGRTPQAQTWRGVELTKVDLAGTIKIANRRREAVQIEVVRHVLGHIDGAEQGGEATQLAPEDAWESAGALPEWWQYYSWPWWWSGVNGVGEIRWTITLEPGGKTQLEYTWHYFWG
jgi:hypothetical protein